MGSFFLFPIAQTICRRLACAATDAHVILSRDIFILVDNHAALSHAISELLPVTNSGSRKIQSQYCRLVGQHLFI